MSYSWCSEKCWKFFDRPPLHRMLCLYDFGLWAPNYWLWVEGKRTLTDHTFHCSFTWDFIYSNSYKTLFCAMLISQCYLRTSANKLYINILKCQEGEQFFLHCGLFHIFQVWLPVKEMVYIVRVPNCSVILFWKELRRGEFPRLDFIKIQR
jgi:hypothetical protein